MKIDNIIDIIIKKRQIILIILKFWNLSFINPQIGPKIIIEKPKNKGAYCINVPLIDNNAPYTLNVLNANPIANSLNIDINAIFQILLLNIAAFKFFE